MTNIARDQDSGSSAALKQHPHPKPAAPTPDSHAPDDATSLMRTEQKWRQIERVLSACGELRDVIATADHDTVLAIIEHGPSWEAAQAQRTSRGGVEAFGEAMYGTAALDPGAWILQRAYARLAEVSPDADFAELAREAADADARYATVEP